MVSSMPVFQVQELLEKDGFGESLDSSEPKKDEGTVGVHFVSSEESPPPEVNGRKEAAE